MDSKVECEQHDWRLHGNQWGKWRCCSICRLRQRRTTTTTTDDPFNKSPFPSPPSTPPLQPSSPSLSDDDVEELSTFFEMVTLREQHYLYVLVSEHRKGEVKVGRTKNLVKRLHTHQCSDPSLHYAYLHEVPRSMKPSTAESRAHRMLKHARRTTLAAGKEWFSTGVDEAKDAVIKSCRCTSPQ